MPDLRALVHRALPDVDTPDGEHPQPLPASAHASLVTRIESAQGEMQSFVDEVTAAFEPLERVRARNFERPGGFGDMQYDASGVRADPAAAHLGVGSAQMLPAAMLIGASLDMRFMKTGGIFGDGTRLAGKPQFEAVLFVRRGLDASGLATAARTAEAHAIADGAVDMVPLGVTVGPLYVDDGGLLKAEAFIGTSYTQTDPEVLHAALRTLGLPSFLVPGSIEIRPEFDSDFRLHGLRLMAPLSVARTPLGELSVPLTARRPVW